MHSHEIDFHRFCIDAYGKTNFDEMLWAFNDAISRPLIRDLGYRLDEIIEATNKDVRVPVEKLVIINTGDRSVNTIALGENIKQTVINQSSELDELINKLSDEVLNSSAISEEEKEDLMTDVDTIKNNWQRKTLKKTEFYPF